MLHLFLFDLEPREELLNALFVLLLMLLLLVMMMVVVVVGQTSSSDTSAPSSSPPELLGYLLEGLIVDATSQLAGGQLRSDLLSELHAGAGLGKTGASLCVFVLCAFFL